MNNDDLDLVETEGLLAALHRRMNGGGRTKCFIGGEGKHKR